jgi:CTP:molybdopterin cytidylyltransferase MocA
LSHSRELRAPIDRAGDIWHWKCLPRYTPAKEQAPMTVAAIVIVPNSAAALAHSEGEPVIRRLVQSAWAGGALPIVVVCPDADTEFERAMVELQVVSNCPDPSLPHGIGWFAGGQQAAVAAVVETSASLLWPFRYSWIDPETVTSLIEAHGAAPDTIIRPTYGDQGGFPILVPNSLTGRLKALAGLHGEEAIEALIAAGVASLNVELGDPGIVHDSATARSNLPDYQGPPAPVPGSVARLDAEPAD